MIRRRVLMVLLSTIGLSGCVGETDDTDSDNTDPTSDNDASDEGTESEEGHWGEGTSLAKISVDEEFDGEITLKADCRDVDSTIEPGETVSLDRQESGEACSIRLLTDGEAVYDTSISEMDKYEIDVDEDGEIKEAIETI